MGQRDQIAGKLQFRGSSSVVIDQIEGALALPRFVTLPTLDAGNRAVPFVMAAADGGDRMVIPLRDGNGDYFGVTIDPTGTVSQVTDALGADTTVALQALLDSKTGELGESNGGGTLVLPARDYPDLGTLYLSNHVGLVGAGDGTYLKAKTNIGGPLLSHRNEGDRFMWVANLRLDGNKANQSTGSNRVGIDFNLPDDPGSQEYADAYFKLHNLTVINTRDGGIRLRGRGEGKLSLVNVRDCDGIGFELDAADCDLNLCSAGNSGLEGFVITQANNRVSNAKAFYSGRINGASGHGFRVEGTHTVTGMNCEAQDNNFHGFYAKTADRIQWWGCTADSNNAGHEGDSDRGGDGFHFDTASYGVASGTSRDRGLATSGNTRQQKHAIGFVNGAAYTSFDLKSDGNLSGHVRNGWHTNISGRINGYGAMQELSYAATCTPNPTEGNYVVIGALTGNITINPPAAANTWTGQELTFEFTQDVDGGAVVTFHADYLTDFVLNVGAGQIGTVAFRYNGTAWIQTAKTENLS